MNPPGKPPVLELLSSHWLSLLGAGLVTTAGFSWLFALPAQIRGHVSNPYIGVLLFVILPIIFVLGLILIPVGIYLARKRVASGLAAPAMDRKTYLRRIAIFFGIVTAANLVIGTQVTYRAVEHMETVQFCGQTCHVMKPEFTAHQNTAHSRLECVECHVSPGVGGWLQSKMAGTRQLMGVVLNNYERPIASAMESNRLVPASGTCEQCHWPQKSDAVKFKVMPVFAEDEKNSRTDTVMMLLIGGGDQGGIHGAHLRSGIEISYAASDAKRQTIPWVEWRDTAAGKSKTFVADGTKPEDAAKLPKFQMQCVDCHNRPTHAFELPERAVNKAMAAGKIPTGLPFIRKKSVELLKANYESNDAATTRIPAALADYYRQKYPDVSQQRSAEIASAGKAVAAIYNRNVFPDLKVTWGTYPDNLGHTDFTGCFRCHDGAHNTADQKESITQDCNTCHEPLAVEEAKPQILKTLALEDWIATLQKK
jgi:nitrate/TMAO reductase-like tetraheme cytochrome c subunit